MRIIGGKYRGRILAEFQGKEIRPTADRVKESLFNILARQIPAARVLDLFCGSGSLGIECLSRGAREAVFNDVSKESLAVLQKNLKTLTEPSVVSCRDYLVCLGSLQGEFDIIFIDPPYRFDYGIPALTEIAKRNLLSENGIVVYERDRAFTGTAEGLEQYDERKYGKTYLTFFRRSVE